MLTRFLLFLDASAPRYWTAVGLAGAVTLGLALMKHPRRATTMTALLFWSSVAVTLLAGRWPGVMFPVAFSVDEDEFLAQALTAARDPVPWESFDGQTSGPLNTLALVPPAWFGAPLGYVTARLVGLGTVLVGLWALHGLLRRAFGDGDDDEDAARLARVGILPLLGFYTWTDFNDFMHYTSEHLPAALEMAAFAGTAALGFANRRRVGAWALGAGFLLGMIPFAKLQAVPAALVTAAAGYGFLLARRGELGERRWRGANATFTAGGLLFPLGLMALLVVRGVFGDFWRSYLQMQFVYLNQPDPTALAGLWERVPDFWAWAWPTLGWSVAGALAAWPLGGWRVVGRPGRLLAASATAALAASLYEIYQPHRPYGHYLLFAVFPAGTLAAVVLGVLLAPRPEDVTRGGRVVPRAGGNVGRWALVVAVFLLAGLTPLVVRRARAGHLWRGRLPESLAHRPPEVVERLRAHLSAAAGGGENRTMAVWGWWPELYVLTAARMGTRDAHAQHQIEAGPMLGYYRARFLADLTRNRPALFVDAAAPGAAAYHDGDRFGFEHDPALAAHVAAHYDLAEEVAGVRIFTCREKVPGSSVTPGPAPGLTPPGPAAAPASVPEEAGPGTSVPASVPPVPAARGEPGGPAPDAGTPSSPAAPAPPPAP